jgi:hypothetical protein
MHLFKYILVLLLLLATGLSAAQGVSDVPNKNASAEAVSEKEGEWFSYRDAYKAMLRFEKYGKSKNLIENRFQVSASDGTSLLESLRLSLVSKAGRINLPLDATGRVVLPLQKAAYDDNAELVLNQSAKQTQFKFRARASIALRADGIYDATDLRSACEQLLAYQNYLGSDVERWKRCVGVRFIYPKKGVDALVELKSGELVTKALPAIDGAAFWNDTNLNFKTVTYLFSSDSEKLKLVTRNAPIAISALFN